MPPYQPLTNENSSYWKNRLNNITATSKRQFGTMEPEAMFCHLRRTLEPVLGEYTPPDAGNFFTRTAIFRAIFLAMPWPKGKVKVPDWLTPAAEGNLEEERTRLYNALDRFLAMHAENPKAMTPNPLLGPISLEYVSRLQGKHLDHHCQQFGV